MVQIHKAPQRERSPSFGERLSSGIGRGLEMGQQLMSKQDQNEQFQKQKQQLSQLTGMDLTQINDPKILEKAFEMYAQGQNQTKLEQLKQGGKSARDVQKQDFFTQLFSSGNQQRQEFTDLSEFSSLADAQDQQINQVPDQQKSQSKPRKFTDQQIMMATNMDPNLGREMRMANDEMTRQERHDEDMERKRFESDRDYTEKLQKKARDEELFFHKESEKYDEELFKQAKVAKKQFEIIKESEKALNSGKVKPSSLANIFKGLGPIGDKLSSALLNKNEAVILSAIPEFLEGRKELFGVRLSDADLRLLQDKLPDIGKSTESNKAILGIMRKYAEASQIRHDVAKDIKKNNKGLRPLGYAERVEERYDELMKPVKIINPNTGNVIEIPTFELGDAISSGASLYNE